MTQVHVAVRLAAHLPGVVLADGACPLAGGVIRHISFGEWQTFDRAFADTRQNFERTRPVFWDVRLLFECPDTDDLITASWMAANEALHGLHFAFLIGPGQPWLPSPILSSYYLCFDASPPATFQAMRLYGPMEREWLIFGGEINIVYDQPQLVFIEELWQQLRAKDAAVRSLHTALSTLERTARPESWLGTKWRESVSDFLQCVACCESLLLGEDTTFGKLDIFAPCAASLDHAAGNERPDLRSFWGDVYRLRNALIHGRIALETLTREQTAMLAEPRRLLALIVRSQLNPVTTAGS